MDLLGVSMDRKTATRITLLTLASVFGLFGCTTQSEAPYAVRDERQITIEPNGMTFEIPQKWLEWHIKFSNNLHLSKEELAAVKERARDTEYSIVVNSALPFEHCVAHIGREGWGSYSDIQVRVYVLDSGVKELESWFEQKGLAAAQEVTDGEVMVESDDSDTWKRRGLAFSLHYGDYGGTARVDMRYRRVKAHTIAFVFMYSGWLADDQETIEDILSSFNY